MTCLRDLLRVFLAETPRAHPRAQLQFSALPLSTPRACPSSSPRRISNSEPPQELQQSQPVYPWSAHAQPFRQPRSPFLRKAHTLFTSATSAGKLFLFGGYLLNPDSPSNDLYVISTRDFSTTLLQTSGDAPSPRFEHRAVLTSNTLLIWGGRTISSKHKAQSQSTDTSFYLLDLGMSDLLGVKAGSS